MLELVYLIYIFWMPKHDAFDAIALWESSMAPVFSLHSGHFINVRCIDRVYVKCEVSFVYPVEPMDTLPRLD